MKTHNFALMDIDTQNDFMLPEGSLYVPEAKDCHFNIIKLIQKAADLKIPIISSVDAHPVDDPEFESFPPHCIIGTKGQEKLSGTQLPDAVTLPQRALTSTEKAQAAQARQIILKKNVFDVFSNPNTHGLLKKKQTKTVVICGVATDYCVKAAAENLLTKGYKVWLVLDAIKGVNKEQSTQTLNMLAAAGAKWVTFDEVLIAWIKTNKEHIS